MSSLKSMTAVSLMLLTCSAYAFTDPLIGHWQAKDGTRLDIDGDGNMTFKSVSGSYVKTIDKKFVGGQLVNDIKLEFHPGNGQEPASYDYNVKNGLLTLTDEKGKTRTFFHAKSTPASLPSQQKASSSKHLTQKRLDLASVGQQTGSTIGINRIKLGMTKDQVKNLVSLNCKYTETGEQCRAYGDDANHIGSLKTLNMYVTFDDARLSRITCNLMGYAEENSHQVLYDILREKYGKPFKVAGKEASWRFKGDVINLSFFTYQSHGLGGGRNEMVYLEYLTKEHDQLIKTQEAQKNAEKSHALYNSL